MRGSERSIGMVVKLVVKPMMICAVDSSGPSAVRISAGAGAGAGTIT